MAMKEVTRKPRRRRWRQLSLRSLLMLMLLVAIYVAGWMSGRRGVAPEPASFIVDYGAEWVPDIYVTNESQIEWRFDNQQDTAPVERPLREAK